MSSGRAFSSSAFSPCHSAHQGDQALLSAEAIASHGSPEGGIEPQLARMATFPFRGGLEGHSIVALPAKGLGKSHGLAVSEDRARLGENRLEIQAPASLAPVG